MADRFKPIHSYSDPGVDTSKSYDYELSLRMDALGLAYAVLDTNTNKFLLLESYDLAEPGSNVIIPGEKEPDKTDLITRLFDSDLKWLTGSFSKSFLCINRGKATLVPEALFDEQEIENLYNFNVAGGPHKGELKYDRLTNIGAVSIYHVPAAFADFIKRFFPDAAVMHHSSVFIQALFNKFMNHDNNNTLFVNTARSRLDILRIKGKKLDYYNSFLYNTADDYMYYLIFVVEQLGLNPENVDVVMMGEIEKHSVLTDLVYK